MGVFEALQYDILGSGIVVGDIVLALIILVAGYLSVRWVSNLVSRRLRAAKVPDLTEVFLVRLFRALLYIGVLGLSLAPLGVDLTSLVVGFAVIGIIVGLAVQGVFRNILAGLLISIYRPFKRGDTVTVAGQTGKVDMFGVAAVVLRTPDNLKVTIPNSAAWDDAIVNRTAFEIRRLDVPVTLAQDQEISRALDVLLSSAGDHEKVLNAPKPAITVKELGPGSVETVLSVWCRTADHAEVASTLLVSVKAACDAEGVVLYQGPIGGPYPAGPRF